MAGSNRKKKRKQKISNGSAVGSRPIPLTEIEKACMGRGRVQAVKHVRCESNWRGASFIGEPFDKVQADINREMYPNLF